MTVHVMEKPDQALKLDESVCDTAHPGGCKTAVVYHPDATLVGQHFVCDVCGEGAHRGEQSS